MTLIDLYRVALDDLRRRTEALSDDGAEVGMILIPYDLEDLTALAVLNHCEEGGGTNERALRVLRSAVAAIKETGAPDFLLDEDGNEVRRQ